MSFYGNSYYYATEYFANIILKNLGRDNCGVDSETIFPKQFIEVDKDTNIELTAKAKGDSFSFCTGNDWIRIGSSSEIDAEGQHHSALSISHGPAVRQTNPEQDDKFILPFDSVIEEDFNKTGLNPDNISTLKFGEYVRVPMIEYDNAGHILSDTAIKCSYFKMPNDPYLEVQESIDAFNTAKEQLDIVLSETGPIKTAEQNAKQASNNAFDALERVNAFKSSTEEILNDINANIEVHRYAINGVSADIAEIQKTLQDIQRQIESLTNLPSEE